MGGHGLPHRLFVAEAVVEKAEKVLLAVAKPIGVVPLEDCLDGMRDGARVKSIADHDRAFLL